MMSCGGAHSHLECDNSDVIKFHKKKINKKVKMKYQSDNWLSTKKSFFFGL